MSQRRNTNCNNSSSTAGETDDDEHAADDPSSASSSARRTRVSFSDQVQVFRDVRYNQPDNESCSSISLWGADYEVDGCNTTTSEEQLINDGSMSLDGLLSEMEEQSNHHGEDDCNRSGNQNLFADDSSSSSDETSAEAFSDDPSLSIAEKEQSDGLMVAVKGDADDEEAADEPKKKAGMSWWAMGLAFLGGVASMAAVFACFFQSSGDVVDEGDAAAGVFPTASGGGEASTSTTANAGAGGAGQPPPPPR